MSDELAEQASASANDPKARFARRFQRKSKKGWNLSPCPNGSWLARVTDPHTGARQGRVFPSKTDAETWAQSQRAKFQLKQDTAVRTPFQEIVDQYLVHLARTSRSALHKSNIKHILDAAIAAPITDLAAPDVVKVTERWLSTLKTRRDQPASPETRNNYILRLRGVAKFAVDRDLLHKNPFTKLGYQKTTKRLKPVFSLDEIGMLVDSKHRDHPFYQAFCCMIYTGFRQREVRFMDWNWFLWDDACIQMVLSDDACASLTDEEAEDEFIPKNGRARGTRLMEELAITMKPDGVRSGPVFPELRNLDTSAFSRRFDAYVKDCGVTLGDRTPHSTRHTWTCLMLASGENSLQVQQYAGHSTSDMTKHYAIQQDRYRVRVRKAGWEPGELRLRDFSPGGKCWKDPSQPTTIAMPR